jgi:hypothetical protein
LTADRSIDAKRGYLARADVLDRHQEAGVKFWAVDCERVYLADIRVTIRASSIGASRPKVDTAVAIYATLALHRGHTPTTIVYREVIPLAGSPRHEHHSARSHQGVQNSCL